MPSDRDLRQMDAGTIATLVRSKQISAAGVTEAALRRMNALEPHLHAFCTPTPEVARAAARAVDAKIAAGEDPGVLAGVPVGIKDLVATKGIATVMGSPWYRDFIPDEDDIVVERLKASRAIILGKTNVSELGYSAVGHNRVFPTTRNPWNTALTPGGSSARSAASVAAGVSPFAIGSDGGGSVRIPASLCGLYGIKASMGRVPLYPGCRDDRYPGVSSWESLEHIGPISRTVTDAALMLNVIAGPDPRDRYSIPAEAADYVAMTQGDIRGLRIAYSEDWGFATVDPEVRRVVSQAVAVFERELGCIVEPVVPGWDDPSLHFAALVAAESDLTGMRRMMRGHEHEMMPNVVAMLNRHWTAEEFTDAKTGRKRFVNAVWRLMAEYDLLITPTLAAPAFPADSEGPAQIDGHDVAEHAWLAFTFQANMTGQPAATIPAGFTSDGRPVGLQITGRHLADATVLRASAAFERARPWAKLWPSLIDQLGL